MSALKKVLGYGLIGLIWLAIWWGIALLVNMPLILPSPAHVISRLFELFAEGDFWLSLLFSLIRILFGLFVSTFLALILAATAFKVSFLEKFFAPAVTVIKSTPIVSFVFVVFVAFVQMKNMNALPAFVTGLIVFPVIYESTLGALKATPKELIEVSDVFGCSYSERVRYLWIPSVLPNFIISSKTSIGLAWKAGVAAEALVASPNIKSIGYELYEAKTYILTTDQFAWTLMIIILSLAIELGFSFAAKKLTDKIL